ncbi:MAG: bacteriophage holin [Salinigranum sp.]
MAESTTSTNRSPSAPVDETARGPVDGTALGRAMGLLWAGAVVALGLMGRRGWGDEWRDLLSDVYLGHDSTPAGLATGAVWAFADAFIGATLLAWLYNRFR